MRHPSSSPEARTPHAANGPRLTVARRQPKATHMNFAELGVPSLACPDPGQAGHHHPHSHPGRDAARHPRRPRRARPWPHRLRQDVRLPAAAGRPARRAASMPAMPRKPRALILAPTRELVGQIDAALEPLAQAAGLSSRRSSSAASARTRRSTALRKGVDIVIACPGRLEDLMGQGHADLSQVEVTILDEADHMADLGFLPGVRRIMDKTPRTRPADAVLRDARQGDRRPGQALPRQARSPTRPTRRSRRSRRWTTTCCTSAASSGCRSSST